MEVWSIGTYYVNKINLDRFEKKIAYFYKVRGFINYNIRSRYIDFVGQKGINKHVRDCVLPHYVHYHLKGKFSGVFSDFPVYQVLITTNIKSNIKRANKECVFWL